MNVVDFAYQVLEMQHELQELRRENKKLRAIEKEYNQFVVDSINNNQQTMNNFVAMLVNPEFTDLVSNQKEQ